MLLGERLEEAVGRVVRDETGLEARVDRQLTIIEYSRRSAFGQTISVVYLASRISGHLKGNQYGRTVRAFTELPSKLISEHRKLLSKIEVLKFE